LQGGGQKTGGAAEKAEKRKRERRAGSLTGRKELGIIAFAGLAGKALVLFCRTA
jgi:hypothetical protein